MTQQQMEAAQKMLPAPGDDAGMALQKMQAVLLKYEHFLAMQERMGEDE